MVDFSMIDLGMIDLNVYWVLLIVASLVLGFGTQIYIKSRYKKWGKVANTLGYTGGQAARKMLDANGLYHVAIDVTSGTLTDHFNPKTNTVSLSEQVYYNRSVSALASACHECGHAVQYARSYVPATLRSAMILPINIASSVWMFVLIAGIFMSLAGLIWAAIGLYAITIIFQLVTLPVEFNASSRAMEYINSFGIVQQAESKGARSVLSAASLTYVAAALVSLMQLLYLVGLARR